MSQGMQLGQGKHCFGGHAAQQESPPWQGHCVQGTEGKEGAPVSASLGMNSQVKPTKPGPCNIHESFEIIVKSIRCTKKI